MISVPNLSLSNDKNDANKALDAVKKFLEFMLLLMRTCDGSKKMQSKAESQEAPEIKVPPILRDGILEKNKQILRYPAG